MMTTKQQFGEFFQGSRKALGLTLRDFCRRNGFDPGNVSRLERGLSAPPQAQRVLESYAKALKLKPKTDRWDRFFELAAAATGRIPQESGGPGHRNWVKARQLEDWANTRAAQATLPQLIRRLVHATGRNITRIEFPAGEQVQRPGLDGVVETAGADPFVPEGRSVWEMGVDKNPVAKAQGDFAKPRSQNRGLDKKTTYIFVTPRKWQTKGAWMDAKAKLGVWRDVRVYDSAVLEEWLERAPAVDVWLARVLELRPEGLTDIDEYWANLETLTEPSLKPEVFLTSRGKEVEELRKWLEDPPGVMVIETRSPSEAVDFVAAASRKLAADSFAARTVIIESKEAWRAIARSDNELVLIAHPALSVEPEMVAEAVRQGHHVILSSRQSSAKQAFKLALPRVSQYNLQQALISSGLNRPRATDLAGKVGGSLTVLKRLLGRFPGTTQPQWSQQPAASALVPVLLAGAWDETSDGDRQVLERLSSQSYHEVSTAADHWVHHADPPITRVLSHLSLVSRDDAWFLLAHAVTHEHLQRFEDVALDVLGKNDPAYELLADERWLAKIKNKVLKHSQALRTGLAETLALLGGRPELVPNVPSVRSQVAHIVRSLLDGKDWQCWASLSPQLPLLAEASPDAFLHAIERDLRRNDSGVLKLFEQEVTAPFSSSPYVGLLWALEGLAWDRDFLPRVSHVLATLDELAPPGQLANRPMQSLREIFMPWFPQTTAPVEERLTVLSAIAHKWPAAGWRLLLDLLPNRFSTASPIRRPAYRDWALAWQEGTTNTEYEKQVNECAMMLVESLEKDLGRWRALIKHFENLPGLASLRFLEKLRSFDVSMLDSPARREITEALRDKIGRHRQFSDAGWALPENILTQLEEVQRRFEPEDPLTRNAWLFDEMWHVQEQAGGKEENAIIELRRGAIQQVRQEYGWDGVLSLAEAALAPDELGAIVGETGSAKDDAKVLPQLLRAGSEKMSRFVGGYVRGRFGAAGWKWVHGLKPARWSASEVGEVALVLPFEPKTWQFVAKKGPGAEEHYWQNTRHFMGSADPMEVGAVVSMLLKFHRPFRACVVIATALRNHCPLEPRLIMEVLEAGLNGPSADSDRKAIGDATHSLLELLQDLQKGVMQKDPAIDSTRVAGLEWGYLGLLDGHPVSPDTLHEMLKSMPEFFVNLLGLVFRPSNEAEDAKTELSEEHETRARNAYRLLMSWESVPGSRVDKSVDEEALFDWLEKARSLAEQQGHLRSCDFHIGNVFAYSPFELDGVWPCIPVRDAIEELASDDVADGFEVAIHNKRGVYGKRPEDGGDQERVLGRQHQDWAEVCKIEWPRTAASLRRVAEGYADQARREDVTKGISSR